MKRNNYKLLAFTLAEVLITLGIVGMIAQMTIPTLMQNVQKNVVITQLQKVTSSLGQSILLSIGEGNSLATPANNLATDNAAVKAFLLPYLKVMTTCENSELTCGLTTTKCLHNANAGLALGASAYRYILTDGSSIGFNVGSAGKYRLHVDVDGPTKGRNRMGYDTFLINIDANPPALSKLVPGQYYETDGQGCADDNHNSGAYCYDRVVTEGWNLNYWK